MAQIVCPNVEKHAMNMMAELFQMKRENDHCDFTVQVGDDACYTHRNVLSADSDYFKAMLKHDTKESREGKVVFVDVDFECVKNCIDFIYSGKFEIKDEKMKDLLHVAVMMQLEDVKQAVSDVLKESITVENYFFTRYIADMYELDDVSTRCRVFFHENIMEISNQPEFGNIEKNEIFNFVQSRKSKLCEEEKITLSLKWVEKNQKNNDHLRECIEAIKFDEISSSVLEHLLESSPIVINDFELYKLITGHLLKASKTSDKPKLEIGNDESLILFDEDTDCIRTFNPITEKVEEFCDGMFLYLKPFVTTSVGSYIYVFCGNKCVHRLNFQSKSSKWEKMKDMICDHGRHPSSVSLLGTVFVIGGSYPTATSDVETFTPSINQWFQLQNKPTAICYASLVSLNDSIYCVGGLGQDGFPVSSICRFTPFSSEWVDLKPMRYPAYGSGVVAIGQKIFVIGGVSGKGPIKNVKFYNVTSDQWTSLQSMDDCFGRVSAHHVDKWIYAVPDFRTSDDIQKYDISKDKWIKVKPQVDRCFEIYRSIFVKMRKFSLTTEVFN